MDLPEASDSENDDDDDDEWSTQEVAGLTERVQSLEQQVQDNGAKLDQIMELLLQRQRGNATAATVVATSERPTGDA